METVYILQVVTICITVVTLILNVLVTFITSRQDNYNKIITKSRLEFMTSNRENAGKFAAEAKYFALTMKSGVKPIDIKDLYISFEHLCIALKPYNDIDNKIIDTGKYVITLVENSLIENNLNELLNNAIDDFVKLINIYDDADWKFIKQQFNSTNKNSDDFDKICDEIKLKHH